MSRLSEQLRGSGTFRREVRSSARCGRRQSLGALLALGLVAVATTTSFGQTTNSIRILSGAVTNGALDVVFTSTQPAGSHFLMASSNLITGSWRLLASISPTPDGPATYRARISLTNTAQQFIRVASLIDGPDLVGVSFFSDLPTTFTAGTPVFGNMQVRIQNRSTRSVPLGQKIDLAILARPVGEGADVFLHHIEGWSIGGLRGGAPTDTNSSLVISNQLAPDDYQLVVVIDSNYALAERFEDNNELTDPTVRHVEGTFVDLFTEIRLVELSSTPRAGDAGRAVLTVGNVGNLLAQGAIRVELFASTDGELEPSVDTLLGAITNFPVALPAQLRTDVPLTIQFPIDADAETYRLIARIQPVSGITDTNIANDVFASEAGYQLRQEFGLEDFRGFDLNGASWTYEQIISTTLTDGVNVQRADDAWIGTVRVEALQAAPSGRTRVVMTQGGKDVSVSEWQTDEMGTYSLGRQALAGASEISFGIERLPIAPAQFNPKSGAVFSSATGFSGFFTNGMGESPFVLGVEGEARSKLRLLGYEDVLLQSGEEFDKTFKFELSMSLTSSLSVVIEGELAELATFSFDDVTTAWAASGFGVVRSLSRADISIFRGGDPFSISSSVLAELVRPDLLVADAVDATNFVWYTGTGRGWRRQTEGTHDGEDAARSGEIDDKKSSRLQTMVIGPGTLSFAWKVSSEQDYDFLRLLRNGNEELAISGITGWRSESLFIPEGKQILEWVYAKDAATSENADAGWLDEVQFIPDTGPPVLVETPESQTVLEGEAVRLHAVVRGAWPFQYEWQKNSTIIPGATNATLTILEARPSDAGDYRLVIRNAVGLVQSPVTTVAVVALIPLGEALDYPALNWSNDGAKPWRGQPFVTHDGGDAAQSGHILDSQFSALQTTVIGSGVLTFWWKVSCDRDGYDYLRLNVNGAKAEQIYGEEGWSLVSHVLLAGTNSIEWIYWKDGSFSAGEDAGWIDQVSFVPDAGAPMVVTPPASQNVTEGETVVFQVGWRGQWPFTFQWQKDGIDIGGQTNASLVITNAAEADSGQYRVRVANAAGFTYSLSAALAVRVVFDLATALDAPEFLLMDSGQQAWFAQTQITHDGVDAAQSGAISDNHFSTMEATVTGPGTLRFWWKVSSERNFDFLVLRVDGTEQISISGEVVWEEQSVFVPAGSHNVAWTFEKDDVTSRGQDAGWVDQVSFLPQAPPGAAIRGAEP